MKRQGTTSILPEPQPRENLEDLVDEITLGNEPEWVDALDLDTAWTPARLIQFLETLHPKAQLHFLVEEEMSFRAVSGAADKNTLQGVIGLVKSYLAIDEPLYSKTRTAAERARHARKKTRQRLRRTAKRESGI